MKKIQTDPLNDLRHKPKDRANIVFLKYYIKNRGKYKGWSELRSKTLPITRDTKPGADDV